MSVRAAVDGRSPRDRCAVVLASAGALGFGLGLASAEWQWAVEHAQVLAGLVTYPPDSPVGIAHAKIWSVVPQTGALLLALGVSEITLSKLLSGLVGLVSFQAQAAIVYALSRDATLAVGSTCLVLASGLFDYGVVYPMALLGTGHTYGALGLSWVVLATGLLGMGWYRSGAFLLAASPAVHPGLGVWMAGVALIAALWSRAEARHFVGRAWRALAGGATVTILAYLVHRLLTPDVASIDPAEAARYLRAFVPFWDDHRRPVDLGAMGVRLATGSAVLALAALTLCRDALAPPARLLLRMVAVAAVLGLAVSAWSNAPATMPDVVLVSMPGRFLNVSVLVAGALVLGLAGARRDRLADGVVLGVLVVGLVVSSRSLLWGLVGGRPWRLDPLAPVTVAAVAWVAATLWRGHRAGGPVSIARAAVHVGLAAAVVVAGAAAVGEAGRRGDRFRDWTNDPVFAAASRGRGPLLTGGELFMMQLRTRRPVLLDGGTLDTLPYAIEQGPAMARILRDVYGINLFDPPPEARGGGRVPHEIGRRVWEAYALHDWQRIGRSYGVADVLAPADWALDLPVVARSGGLALFAIPDPGR